MKHIQTPILLKCLYPFKDLAIIIITNIIIIMIKLTQTSISGPKYFCPSKTSGAAYGGEPHHVERVLRPTEMSFS